MSGIIPLPFVPSRVLTNVRGAVVHDVARRHNLYLTNDARQILAAADSPDPRRARFIGLAAFVTRRLLRRLGPLWFFTPTFTALETFALGHLFGRYLEHARKQATVRVQADEARYVRARIDRALLRTLSPDVHARRDLPPDVATEHDDRDDIARIIDWALLSSASFPAYIIRRMEMAFDAGADESREES
jgi:hypothetical protein